MKLKKIVKKILINRLILSFTLWIYSIVFADKKIKKMVKFFHTTFKANKQHVNSLILVDFFPVEETLLSYAFFLNQLKKINSSKIVPFCYGDSILPLWAQSIYKSFGSENIYRVYSTSNQMKESVTIVQNLRRSIKSKEDLTNLELKNVTIGIDIYESILRDFNVPTVDLSTEYTWDHIQKGIEIFFHWYEFLEKNNVAGIVLSHDNYMWMNILAKLGYIKNIPVYLPSSRFIVKPDGDFSTYKLLASYKEWFDNLNPSLQIEGLLWAREQIEIRFSGAITEEVYYSDKSPYAFVSETKFKLTGQSKTKVLIASHCFYDNPHAYSKLDYTDFYDWLNYLGSISIKTDYDWYLKVHPDPLPGTLETVSEILKKYPGINLIPHTESHHNLISQGINWVVTCYGTIGEEYPLLGANVINCGYNPRINFDFNYHLLTKESLANFIFEIGTLKTKPYDKQEVYKFIFCHHRLRYKDDLVFPSYRLLLSSLKSNMSAFEFYLSVINDEQKNKTLKYMENFIISKNKYMTELGPINL